jgi:hypothetical protein
LTDSPDEPARPVDRDTRAAVRTAWLTVAATVALLVGIVVVVVARQTSNGDGGEIRQGAGQDRGRAAIGPAPGDDLVAYAAARQSALAERKGDDTRTAVVSLNAYRSERAARAIVDETPRGTAVEVVALLVASPGDAPAVVQGSLAEWVAARKIALQDEHDQIAQIVPTVESDPQFRAFYEREVVRLERAAGLIDPQADIVFGFVVRAPISALRALADRAPVRLVDLGRDASFEQRSIYRGVLPDDTITVSDPQLRRLPPG